MKTTCYCVFCPKHPWHEERHSLEFPTNWEPGQLIWKPAELLSGKEVDCLEPVSDAFANFGLDEDEFEYPTTAYGGGCSQTGVINEGFTIFATCGNEEYQE